MRLASLGTWNKRPQWRCGLCTVTTLSAEGMRRHIVGTHHVKRAFTIPDEPQVKQAAQTTDTPPSDDGKEEHE